MRCTLTFVGSTCVCENYLPLKHFEHRLFVWGELREMGMCTISAQPRHRPPSLITYPQNPQRHLFLSSSPASAISFVRHRPQKSFFLPHTERHPRSSAAIY